MIDLSRYRFEKLLEGEEFALFRGRSDDAELPTILLAGPVSEHPVPGILERLQKGIINSKCLDVRKPKKLLELRKKLRE